MLVSKVTSVWFLVTTALIYAGGSDYLRTQTHTFLFIFLFLPQDKATGTGYRLQENSL